MKRCIKTSETILGHAKKLSDIGAEIEESTQPIVQHLAKLYLFPESRDVDHWREEVATFLNSVPLRKGKNKLPSAQFIYKNTFEANEAYIAQYYNVVCVDYVSDDNPVTRQPRSINDFVNKVKLYYIWLSNNLSRFRVLPNLEIKNELKDLGF